MKISEHWLREWVNPAVEREQLVQQLNRLGLEVGGLAPAAAEFSNVVVAEIIAIEPHPNADRLRVCQVAAGEADPLQIVCGAANAAVGLKAPLAKVGAELPHGLQITGRKLRGVASAGMLCSAVELGLVEQAEGLLSLPGDAPVGMDLREYLQLDDWVIDIELTPNRGDCLSVLGVAREIALANRLPPPTAPTIEIPPQIDTTFPVRVDAPDACPRYIGRVMHNVNIQAATPVWMLEKLRRGGIRSINIVVDISNYVMLELGQPMHAFDLQRLAGGIQVRWARTGERLALLDGSEIELDSNSLVIADQQQPCALAGIMGGGESAIAETTQQLFLESAFFTPAAILGRSRKYGKHTDSSHRFERGVDPALPQRAIERATGLILEFAGGQAGPLLDVSNAQHLPVRPTIELRLQRVRRVLGAEFTAAQVTTTLQNLGCQIAAEADNWRVQAPSCRFDLAIEADLIEEVARVYGYDHLPRRVPAFIATQLRQDSAQQQRLTQILVAQGYREIVAYSFVAPEIQALVAPDTAPLTLSNPISAELSVMRSSLWTSLLNTLRYNLHRQQTDLSLFEIGARYLPEADRVDEQQMIAGLRYGSRTDENWSSERAAVDFFDIKADVERLLQVGGHTDYRFVPVTHPALHPGQSAELYIGQQSVGYLGAVHPRIEQALELSGTAYLFELLLAPLLEVVPGRLQAISKYPSIRRDIAIVVDQVCTWSQVRECIEGAAPEYLVELRLFDVYAGEGIKSGRKSFAMGLILQEISRTLTDTEIDAAMADITAALAKELGGSLRE